MRGLGFLFFRVPGCTPLLLRYGQRGGRVSLACSGGGPDRVIVSRFILIPTHFNPSQSLLFVSSSSLCSACGDFSNHAAPRERVLTLLVSGCLLRDGLLPPRPLREHARPAGRVPTHTREDIRRRNMCVASLCSSLIDVYALLPSSFASPVQRSYAVFIYAYYVAQAPDVSA